MQSSVTGSYERYVGNPPSQEGYATTTPAGGGNYTVEYTDTVEEDELDDIDEQGGGPK